MVSRATTKKMTIEEYIKTNKIDPIKSTSLCCSGKMIHSLDGIELMPNLTFFDCSNNYLNSLDGIELLGNLKCFAFANNNISSLKGLGRLHNLSALYGQGNPIAPEELKYLLNLNKLEFLQLQSTYSNKVMMLRNGKNFYEGIYENIFILKTKIKYISNIHNLLR